MDILAHMLWTNAGGKGINAIVEKKRKPELKVNLAWATFFRRLSGSVCVCVGV
jgi:hypothetical protein